MLQLIVKIRQLYKKKHLIAYWDKHTHGESHNMCVLMSMLINMVPMNVSSLIPRLWYKTMGTGLECVRTAAM